MKAYKILLGVVFIFSMMFYFTSCEKDDEVNISAKLLGSAETDVLQGDSIYLTLEIDGGQPPYAFRYYYDVYNEESNDYDRYYRNVIGIAERTHTFAEYKNDTTTFVAESVASYYQNVGTATGTATVNVLPVEYVYEETINATKTGYIQKSANQLDFSKPELLLKNNAGDYTRIVYFEFDATDIQNVKEKNRYTLKFWLVGSHSQGVNVSSLMEVKGKVGALSNDMSWEAQPGEANLTDLFNTSFKATSTGQQIEFSGEIDAIVYEALQSEDKKFTIRVLESLNGVGSGGYFFIGGNLYTDETKRPTIEVKLRQQKVSDGSEETTE